MQPSWLVTVVKTGVTLKPGQLISISTVTKTHRRHPADCSIVFFPRWFHLHKTTRSRVSDFTRTDCVLWRSSSRGPQWVSGSMSPKLGYTSSTAITKTYLFKLWFSQKIKASILPLTNHYGLCKYGGWNNLCLDLIQTSILITCCLHTRNKFGCYLIS